MRTVADKLLAALKSIADEQGLTRIDLGYLGWNASNPAYCTVWFDAPEGVNGCASGEAPDFDTAIDRAVIAKELKLAAPLIAEAA